MNASELRIGNFVELTCEGHEDEPDLVIWGIEDYEYYDYRMNDINPIPITEDLLVKCGFVKDGEGDYCKGDFCFRWQFNALTLLLDTGYIKPPLMHIHQLQNLYFALTGEELTINL